MTSALALPPTIVFDLDGTLVDTAADLAGAMNHCLSLEGLPHLTADSVRSLVGHGARALLRRGLAAAGDDREETIDRLVPEFLRFYADNIVVHSQLYPGARAVLEQLAQSGCALGVCTNKPEVLSLALMERLDLLPYFGAIFCGDTLAIRKPDPAHLLATIDKLGGTASSSVMVGDSGVDIDTAHAAQVPVIGVSFGFSTDPIETLSPTVVVHAYDEMIGALQHAHATRS
jgi:phosphoglycolate phosphatase